MGFVMEVDVIHSEERGATETKEYLSKHTFSFGQYHNLNRLNFGTLRVFNEDRIKPSQGFSTHRHDNMEIVTLVLDGALEHRDSLGSQKVLERGQVQRMTAGTGIEHSEINALDTEEVHFLQIWIYPEERGLAPSHEIKSFSPKLFHNRLFPIVSKITSKAALTIHQDATLYRGDFDAEERITHRPRSKAHGTYLFVIDGELKIGDVDLKKGDSAQITQADWIEGEALRASKILLIEVNVNTL